MTTKELIKLLKANKQKKLYHRYITNDDIKPLIDSLNKDFLINRIGFSVNENKIYSITVGKGPKRILMWSQMHGNESTTTKALFDLFNIFLKKNKVSDEILTNCTLKIIPILNPDGAYLYTRANANDVDLNRDAQDLSQPESVILRNIFEEFKPDFCFNLHGQRTIFSAGTTNKPATISFLAPAQDDKNTITKNRKQAMKVIVEMKKVLQSVIPNQVGIYDDSFNLNCVGDTFQSKNVPTILFEVGHYQGDYYREEVRTYIGLSLLTSLTYIANNKVSGVNFESYFDIPKNDKLFFDIIIRNALLNENETVQDISIQYSEVLKKKNIEFVPRIQKIGNLNNYYGHLEVDANSKLVQTEKNEILSEGYENDFVLINNELFSLKPRIH